MGGGQLCQPRRFLCREKKEVRCPSHRGWGWGDRRGLTKMLHSLSCPHESPTLSLEPSSSCSSHGLCPITSLPFCLHAPSSQRTRCLPEHRGYMHQGAPPNHEKSKNACLTNSSCPLRLPPPQTNSPTKMATAMVYFSG